MTPGLVLAVEAPMEWELHCSMKGLDASEGDPMCVGCPPPRSGNSTAEPPRTPEKKISETATFTQRKELRAPYSMGWSRMGWGGVGKVGDRDRIGMEYVRKRWDGIG